MNIKTEKQKKHLKCAENPTSKNVSFNLRLLLKCGKHRDERKRRGSMKSSTWATRKRSKLVLRPRYKETLRSALKSVKALLSRNV